MKDIELEMLVMEVILSFCENAAELGCPSDTPIDMWFRELCHSRPYEEVHAIGGKLIDIMMDTVKKESVQNEC